MPGERSVIGILVCDHIEGDDLVGAAGGADYGAMYTDLLRLGDPSLAVRVHDAVNGELPGSADECDGWIITGARHDSYADLDWIVALRAFVVELRDRAARTVGVCFGHQLVAHALGGEAGPAGEWRAGPQRMEVAPTPWFDGGTVWLQAMHQDIVRRLPPGAVDVATGTTAAHPMYTVGDSILCIQDHPEYDRRYISALIEARRSRLGDAEADEALARVAAIPTDNPTVARWLTDFLLDVRR